jgi:RNA polymerase sigma factor (sigma-70 family)
MTDQSPPQRVLISRGRNDEGETDGDQRAESGDPVPARATLHQDETGLTDGQLLESYLHRREEAAFAALVRRHGPMVWGVCRRVVGNHQDAEDAFQATFLVLVRKAASVVSVANWLYGVAHQTALKARAMTARRQAREKQMDAVPEPALEQAERDDPLQALLDQELSRLPDKYRAVIVLCDLQGKTRKEAARHFHVPEGTVASRLATARTMLAKRLTRSGLAMSGGTLATLLSQHAASASVPASVASTTIQAATLFAAGEATVAGALSLQAVALAEGVLRTMLLTKLKIVTALLVCGTLLAGMGGFGLRWFHPATLAAAQGQEKNDAPKTPLGKAANAPRTDQQKKQAEALPTHVNGILKAVDAPQQTLTVAHRLGETTFRVAPDADINIDGKRGELAVLPAGATVNLRQFVDATTTRSVQAEGRWLWGVVKAVDVASSTITYGDKAQDGAAGRTFNVPTDLPTITFADKGPTEVAGKTFRVAGDVWLQMDARPGKLADLPIGSYLNITLTIDQQSVRGIWAVGPPVPGIGVVKAVDAEKRTITVDDRTYPVATNANIIIDNRGGLAAIAPGMSVALRLCVDQQTVGTIAVQNK